MFCLPGGTKKVIGLWTYTSVQRYLYPLFQNKSPSFLLFSIFGKLSQPLGQDQPNIKQVYCQIPIIIFLWTPKGFISPESFLNFLLNLYIPPWLQKSFKFIVLWLGIAHFPEQHFLKIFFPEQKEGAEDYVADKIIKINKGIGHKFW